MSLSSGFLALLLLGPLQAAVEIKSANGGYSIERDSLKLVWKPGSGFAFYDLKADPGQARDAIKANPAAACALAKMLLDRLRQDPAKAKPPASSKDVEESLRRIGYTR
ncbi:MAG: hypothetical protein HY921_04835 [Elusimicrobia bacterium]|nr:hypothetical protein [Elusimicrobiota bacterium]